MKVITVTGSWLDRCPKIERPVRIAQVFKLAKEHGWSVRLQGEHWE